MKDHEEFGHPIKRWTRLDEVQDWKRLIAGIVDAISLQSFATPQECLDLVNFVKAHPKAKAYETASSIVRVGSSFSDVRKTNRIAEEYCEQDLLVEAVQVNSVIQRLLGRIVTSWKWGLISFEFAGVTLHRSIARRIVGGGAEPHDDNIAEELPGDTVASTVKAQFGVNLYLEVPVKGGELEGWRRRIPRKEYERLRNDDPKLAYGLKRDGIGECDWVVKPQLGEVIIFRNSELHAIRSSSEPRTTWGFFLGFCGEGKPLLIWS